MKWRDWLEKWGMAALKVEAPFLEMEWAPRDPDRAAAWEVYIELLTRVTVQRLPEAHGDEKAALESVYALFGLTRDTIKKHGPGCQEFTKIAIVVLNQVIRPFTAKWHRESLAGAFANQAKCLEFRRELTALQDTLRQYTRMLGDMAGIEEDLTDLAAP
jgi:hypothetical protein